MSVKKSILSTALVATGLIISSLGFFLYRVWNGRLMDVEVYGALGFLLSFTSLLSFMAASGTIAAIPKLYSKTGRLKEILFSSLVFTFVLSSVIVFLALIVYPIITGFVSADFLSYTLFLLSVPFYAFLNVSLGTERALSRFELKVFSDITKGLLLIFLSMFFAGTLAGASTTYLLAFAVPATLSLLYVLFKHGVSTSFSMLKDVVRLSFILFFLSAFLKVLFSIDILMLSVLMEETFVGIYTAAQTVASIAFLLFTSVSFVFLSTFLQLLKKGIETASTYYNKLSYLLNIAVVVLLFYSFYFSHQIITFLYGERYIEASNVFPMLVLAYITYIALGLVGPAAVALDMERFFIKLSALLTILNVVLNLLLIPAFGIYGAAISSLVSILLLSLILRYELQRKGIKLELKPFFPYITGFLLLPAGLVNPLLYTLTVLAASLLGYKVFYVDAR